MHDNIPVTDYPKIEKEFITELHYINSPKNERLYPNLIILPVKKFPAWLVP